MKSTFYFVIALLLHACTISSPEIHYEISQNEAFEDQELTAWVNNGPVTLVSKNENRCMKILECTDFNKDGYDDLLLEIHIGCGGNCCANQYQIFTYDGEQFIASEKLGYDWDGIEVVETAEGFTFRVETVNEGFGNHSLCEDKVETFLLKGHTLTRIHLLEDKKTPAISAIYACEFEDTKDQILQLKHDLDNDDLEDVITCAYWSRWSRIVEWSIQFGNGRSYKYEGETLPKRIGILSTKTNGMHDLVLECDEVLRWDGDRYTNKAIKSD